MKRKLQLGKVLLFMAESPRSAVDSLLVCPLFAGFYSYEPQKTKNSYFPLYWFVTRNP